MTGIHSYSRHLVGIRAKSGIPLKKLHTASLNVKTSLISLLPLLPRSKGRFDKLLWRVLSVTPGVVLRPSPKVFASIFQRALGLPLQLCIGSCWVRCQVQHITRPASNHLVRQL